MLRASGEAFRALKDLPPDKPESQCAKHIEHPDKGWTKVPRRLQERVKTERGWGCKVCVQAIEEAERKAEAKAKHAKEEQLKRERAAKRAKIENAKAADGAIEASLADYLDHVAGTVSAREALQRGEPHVAKKRNALRDAEARVVKARVEFEEAEKALNTARAHLDKSEAERSRLTDELRTRIDEADARWAECSKGVRKRERDKTAKKAALRALKELQ